MIVQEKAGFHFTRKIVIASLMIICLAAVGVVAASYVFYPSNSVSVTVNPTPSPTVVNLELKVNGLSTPLTLTGEQNVTLTVQTSPVISNASIIFLDNAVNIGTVVTDASGSAQLIVIAAVGTHVYSATGTA